MTGQTLTDYKFETLGTSDAVRTNFIQFARKNEQERVNNNDQGMDQGKFCNSEECL